MNLQEPEPSYYAVIPGNVRYDRDLTNLEKLMYGEITALTKKRGYCFASNSYFAKLYNKTPKHISVVINKLAKKGYVTVEVDKGDGNSRKIWIAIPNHTETYPDESGDPYPDKSGHNNTSSNNIVKIKDNIPLYGDVVDYLNKKVGTKYRAQTPSTKKGIKARWNEGFRLEDFKKVIDNKSAEWLTDPNMNKYLRPETLFGNKFESYLNQQIIHSGAKDGKTPEGMVH